MRRGPVLASEAEGSSGQKSARSSLISTKSSASSFLATFGGTAADGLYGPGLWSARSPSSAADDGIVWSAIAAAARTSRPEGAPPLGVNVGTPDRRLGSGTLPALWYEAQ